MRKLISTLTFVFALLTANCFAQSTLTIGASDGAVTIIDAELTGTHNNQAHVAPGAAFQLHFLYTIVDVGCPSCEDEIQVGFANALPSVCAYDGNPGSAGVSHTTTDLTLTAPTTNGTYYIAFDRAQAYGCYTSGWWNGTPQASQYIAAITVF